MAREYVHTEIHPSGRVDPDKTTVRCENPACQNTVLIGQSYSFMLVFATTGDQPIGAFQCEDEQHFCCSPACAKAAAVMCIDEHLLPAHQAKVAALTPATPSGVSSDEQPEPEAPVEAPPEPTEEPPADESEFVQQAPTDEPENTPAPTETPSEPTPEAPEEAEAAS